MAKVPFFNDDIEFVSKLPNKPTADMGMPPATLKAEFDKAGKAIQMFLNETLIPAVNGIIAITGAVDKTITVDGAPADAKAVGDRLYNVEARIKNDVLKKTGGEMSGCIAMGGNRVTGLGTPADGGDAATKGYVDSRRKAWTVALPEEDWTCDGPYVQSVYVDGITGTDSPHYGVVLSGTTEEKLARKEAFGYIDQLETADGAITFTCLEDKPEVSLTIQLEVNR